MDTCSLVGGGEDIPERHARGRSHSFQPICVVQCGGTSTQEGWVPPLLHQLLQVKCMYEKGFIPIAVSPGGAQEYGGTGHFSMMDLKSRFWQVCMAPESQQYTTFTVGNLGFYEFTHMPFGLCNAPMTFQCLMQDTLGEPNLTYCVIYLDNIIVFGCMEEEHLERLRVVLERFCDFNLKLKPSKCLFFQNEIVYLTHHVSKDGIHPSQENVEDFPMLETFTQACAFCGLMGHYWHFIKGFANIGQPLYDMLGREVKIGPVQLPPETQEAVQILKRKIQTAPVLVFLDFNKSFLLETDTSKEGLGMVPSQKQDDGCYHPVTFGSCSLMPSEKATIARSSSFLH